MKKCLKFFYAFLLTLLFASCSWFNNDPVQPLPVVPQFNTFTISGKLGTNGAMPENFARVLNSRTALATAPSGQTIQYKVLLLAASGATTPIAGSSSESDGTSYTIKYTGTDTTAVRYWLRAVAYYMDGSNEIDILVSPDTQLDTAVDLKGGVFTKDLELRPATTGFGEVELTITLPSTSCYSNVSISDAEHFQIQTSGTTIKIKHKPTSDTNSKLASGSYPLTISFYKTYTVGGYARGVLVYQFDDVINVFNNLKTTVWVDNGNSPHLTTNAGVTTCTITDAMLAEFNTTNFYVGSSTEGLVLRGTFAEPFGSLNDAINYINSVGNDTTTYTIHVKENSNVEDVTTSPIDINKKIKIEVYKTVPGVKNGTYTLREKSGRTLININSGGELTLESDGTGGLHLTTTVGCSYDLVSLSGKMVMYGGRITISGLARPSLLKISNNANAILEMYGGRISGNQHAGIAFEGTNGVLKVAKKPYIYGNTETDNPKNVALPAGKTIQVVGPLEEGALIGVTTADSPTVDHPVTITTGYGYQTGGYNAEQLPGKYFRGDEYGVTEDSGLASPAGEAVLALSGGSLSIAPLYDPTVKFYVDKTFVTIGELGTDAAIFTFSATKVQEGTTVAIPQEDITYTSTLSTKGAVLANQSNYDYQSLDTGIKIKTGWNKMMPGPYEINITAVYGGNTYFASIPIRIIDVKLQEGFKAAPGVTFNGSTTLCNNDTSKKSKYFIAGRNLKIPDLLVCDHEVTQGEYDDYMTWYGVVNYTDTQPNTGYGIGDNYPAYFVNRYEAMMYCNLKSKADKLTPAYYLADSTGAEVANGREVSTWMAMANSKIAQYEKEDYTIVYYYNNNSFANNDILDYGSETDTDGGIRYDESADGWRLPTVAEWEYLARGGNLTDEGQYKFSGSDTLSEVAVSGATSTSEVKSKVPNALGLYDMTGNVFEWCWDWDNTITTSTPITGPNISTTSPNVGHCVTAGGGFEDNEFSGWNKLNSAQSDSAGTRKKDQGFRIVRTIK